MATSDSDSSVPAYLVLEDGSVHRGESMGARVDGHGEVVFNTSMTGYQEVLTDPSYAGQLVTLTYPLVGNYGINPQDFESAGIRVAGFIVREHCDQPSHGRSDRTLDEYLRAQGIPGICGVDTRAITRRLRDRGVMMGLLTTGSPEAAAARLAEMPRYEDQDLVRTVTAEDKYGWDGQPVTLETLRIRASGSISRPTLVAGSEDNDGEMPERRILVTDVGLKYNILRLLQARGCEVIAVPAETSAQDMLAMNPSGILLSPGPGDPQLLDYVVGNVRQILGRVPVMGICLGHQLVARALGADTFKLKFGHRGGNHPVQDLATGRVYITAQNHGFAVNPDTLPPGLEVSHINLNDGTVEGTRHRDMPLFTIQYHSEASPGPRDNEYIFDEFLGMVKEFNH
ncbi:MAG: glutamine-hydrolyzing carbamoyl-phosphate synthase small subunit [Chloroflexi bacterium]|nr:glutamine-hydrolyzing carbamoyl-phosphate synthase small subunit [Chloroflexota bacterium]